MYKEYIEDHLPQLGRRDEALLMQERPPMQESVFLVARVAEVQLMVDKRRQVVDT